ncbi:MAG: hypothetical protein AAF715_19715 [Myxococcota bacterium]
MSSLTEALSEPQKRKQVIDDCVDLVDDEVGRKKGLGGVVIKTGYKAVKGIKPGFIRKVVGDLLEPWSRSLEPIWSEAVGSGAPSKHFASHRGQVADALLQVTDDKAKSAKNQVVRTTYEKLRPTAKKHVEDAVPGLAGVLEKNLT